jgi:hypothetical protein
MGAMLGSFTVDVWPAVASWTAATTLRARIVSRPAPTLPAYHHSLAKGRGAAACIAQAASPPAGRMLLRADAGAGAPLGNCSATSGLTCGEAMLGITCVGIALTSGPCHAAVRIAQRGTPSCTRATVETLHNRDGIGLRRPWASGEAASQTGGRRGAWRRTAGQVLLEYAGAGVARPIAVASIGMSTGEEVGVADGAVRSGFAATSTALRNGGSSEETRMKEDGTAKSIATSIEAVVVAEVFSTSAFAPTSTASRTSSSR